MGLDDKCFDYAEAASKLNIILLQIQFDAHQYLMGMQDKDDFIGNVLYLVAGPEQRAAQEAYSNALR